MNAANVIPLNAVHTVTSGKRPIAPNPIHVRFGPFELDGANARLLCDGLAIVIAPTPFAVLCALVRRPDYLLTTNALLDEVWGHQFVTDSVLRTAISQLRTALGDDARNPRFIETVSRRGYRFIGTTTTISTASSVREIDVCAQASQTGPLPPLRLCGARDMPCEHAFVCAAPKSDTSTREFGWPFPQPVFATMEQVRHAHELKLQVRARLLGNA